MINNTDFNLYEDSGYLNVSGIFAYGTTFNFIVGGRGIGKTYGLLKYILKYNIKSIYLRRTQKQTDIINKREFSPFKPVCADLNLEYDQKMIARDTAALIIDDDIKCYTGALSTFSSLRSFDMSDVECIIFDEFIPEISDKTSIKHEYEAFLNMYETVNRNRELSGRDPVKLIAAANSNNLNNKIFMGLGIISDLDNMIRKEKEVLHINDRSISVYYPLHSPISERKAETALYKLSGDNDFSAMALSNSFGIDESDIINRPLKEFRPVVNVGEICIYKHKGISNFYYVSRVLARGSAPVYAATDRQIAQFKERYRMIEYCYLFSDNFYFDSIFSKTVFGSYIKDF